MPLPGNLAAILSGERFFRIIGDYQTIGQKNLPIVHEESDRFYAKDPLAKVVPGS